MILIRVSWVFLIFNVVAQGEYRIGAFSPAAVEALKYLHLEDKIKAHVKFSQFDAKDSFLVGDFISFNKEKIINIKLTHAVLTRSSTHPSLENFLKNQNIKLLYIGPKSIQEMNKEMKNLAEEFKVGFEPKLDINCEKIKKSCKGKTINNFLVLIQREPPMAAGHATLISDMLSRCNLKNEVSFPEYSRLKKEDLITKKLDFILDIGYDSNQKFPILNFLCSHESKDYRASLPGVAQFVWFNEEI